MTPLEQAAVAYVEAVKEANEYKEDTRWGRGLNYHRYQFMSAGADKALDTLTKLVEQVQNAPSTHKEQP